MIEPFIGITDLPVNPKLRVSWTDILFGFDLLQTLSSSGSHTGLK
jgi:hypothetical protein